MQEENEKNLESFIEESNAEIIIESNERCDVSLSTAVTVWSAPCESPEMSLEEALRPDPDDEAHLVNLQLPVVAEMIPIRQWLPPNVAALLSTLGVTVRRNVLTNETEVRVPADVNQRWNELVEFLDNAEALDVGRHDSVRSGWEAIWNASGFRQLEYRNSLGFLSRLISACIILYNQMLPKNVDAIHYADCQAGIEEVLLQHGAANSFNPVLDLLETLEWDGRDRLGEVYAILGIDEKINESPVIEPLSVQEREMVSRQFCQTLRDYTDIAGASAALSEAEEKNRLEQLELFETRRNQQRNYRELVHLWLLQAVAMEFNTGEYGAEGVLIFTGSQGIGKTRFFSKLAMESRFFGESLTLPNAGERDSVTRATRFWIGELGELDSTTKRADVGALKGFLTATSDCFRLAYARTESVKIRRTVFCGGCNEPEGFLADFTGNRRFWVLPIESIDLNALERLDVRQLWAQVYSEVSPLTDAEKAACFRPTRELAQFIEQENRQYVRKAPGQAFLESIICAPGTQGAVEVWVTPQMLKDAASSDNQLGRVDTGAVGRALVSLGYKRKSKRLNGKVSYMYNLWLIQHFGNAIRRAY